jgi:hypothetical protein
LDGTGKLFANFLKALDGSLSTRVVPYPPDVPLGYDEFEPLVRAALPTRPLECAAAVLSFIREETSTGPALAGPAVNQSF